MAAEIKYLLSALAFNRGMDGERVRVLGIGENSHRPRSVATSASCTAADNGGTSGAERIKPWPHDPVLRSTQRRKPPRKASSAVSSHPASDGHHTARSIPHADAQHEPEQAEQDRSHHGLHAGQQHP